MSETPTPSKPLTKVQKLKSEVYGPPLATFGPGWPTKCQIVQHYVYCVGKMKAEENCKYNLNKNALINEVLDNLLEHWEKQPDPKVLDKEDKEKYDSEKLKIFKEIKSLVTTYEDYRKKTFWIGNKKEQQLISEAKKELQVPFDVDLTTLKNNKRSFEEVSTFVIQKFDFFQRYYEMYETKNFKAFRVLILLIETDDLPQCGFYDKVLQTLVFSRPWIPCPLGQANTGFLKKMIARRMRRTPKPRPKIISNSVNL